jgi:hypothetical protein
MRDGPWLPSAPRSLVGVVPRDAVRRRQRLLGALEAALPVRFEARDLGDCAGLDALVVMDGGALPETHVPCLVAVGPPGRGHRARRRVAFGRDPALDERLRGRLLGDGHVDGTPVPVGGGDKVLATCDGAPAWVLRRPGPACLQLVATMPEELSPDQCLRDRFRAGRFLDLLPLVLFLREVCADHAWAPPPARACLVFDDANLHWRSYGFLRFPDLAAHADQAGYHVSLATVPIDNWFTNGRVARLFRQPRAPLSLSVHGNNHEKGELAQHRSERDALRTLAQALRRVQALERRSGILVDRVMVAPHGVCSEAAIRGLTRVGFEGICIDRSYPWRERPPEERPLAGWEPSDLVAGGVPVVLRQHLDGPRDDLVFRALLGQPLVLYGHHDDAAGGLDLLGEVAEQVNRLGPVRWCSMKAILRSNFSTRREGATLWVRPHVRRIRVELPGGIERVVIAAPDVVARDGKAVVASGDAEDPILVDLDRPNPAFALDLRDLAPQVLDIQVPEPNRVDHDEVPSPSWRPWPIVRRLLTEGRDRASAAWPGR